MRVCGLHSCSRADGKVTSFLIGGNLSSWARVLGRMPHCFPHPPPPTHTWSLPHQITSIFPLLKGIFSSLPLDPCSYLDKTFHKEKEGRLLELYTEWMRRVFLLWFYTEVHNLIDGPLASVPEHIMTPSCIAHGAVVSSQ